MQSVSKVKSFFAAHKAARVLLVIAAALLAFLPTLAIQLCKSLRSSR